MQRRYRFGFAALVLAISIAACGSNGDGGNTSGDDAPPVQLEGEVEIDGIDDVTASGAQAEVTVTMKDNAFSPTFVKATPGANISVSLRNEGDRTHSFTIPGLADVTLATGAIGEANFTLPTDGVVRFACRFHGQSGMQGAFYFTEGEAAASDTTGGDGGYPSIPSDY